MRPWDLVPQLHLFVLTGVLYAACGCDGCGSTELAGDVPSEQAETDDSIPDSGDPRADNEDPDDDVMPSPETWARTYGGVGYDVLRSVRPLSDGGYVATGETYSFGGGTANFWVIRLDRSGEVLWARTYGGAGDDYARDIQETLDGGFIVAGSSSSFNDSTFDGSEDGWALKLDESGLVSWQRSYDFSVGEHQETTYRVIQTEDGGYLFAGAYGWASSWNASLLGRLDAGGEVRWARSYNSFFAIVAVFEAPESQYLVMGKGGVVKLDGHGEILWFESRGGSTGVPAGDGGYAVAGEAYGDLFIIRVDQNRREIWKKKYAVDSGDHASSMARTGDGGFVVAGYSEFPDTGSVDILVIRTDRDGELVWARIYGGPDYDWACCIASLEEGGFVIGATTRSFGAGNDDFWILKVTEEGAIEGSCPENMIRNVHSTAQDSQLSPWLRDIGQNDLAGESEATNAPSVETDVLTSIQCNR